MDQKNNYFSYAFGAILICAALLYISLNRQYRIGALNDDSLYVITASDLWNHSVGNILPQIKPDFPLPGLPLILAPAAEIVKPNWIQLEWLSVIATLLGVLLLGIWARKSLPAEETLLVVILYAFNPTVARFSGILMPAPFYTAVVMGCFLLMRDLIDHPSRLKAIALGFLLGWGSLIRLEGIILLISILPILLISHRKRIFPGALALPLVFWGLFVIAWFRLRHMQRLEYASELSALATYWRHNFFQGIKFGQEMIKVFLETLTAHAFPQNPIASVAGAAAIIFCVVFICIGARQLWRQSAGGHNELLSIGIFFGLYMPTYFFWHLIVPRYYIPLLPFVLILLVKGVTDASVIIGERKLWAGAVFSFFFICYLATNGLAIHESLWARDPMKRPPWRSLKWMEKNTDSDSGIFSLIAPSIALYTERYATSDFRASNVEEFKYYLLKRNIDYILDRRVVALTPAVGATENHNLTWIRIRRWINSRPDEFELVFRDPVEETSIYKITKKHEFIAAYKKYISAAHAYEARHFTDAFQSTLEALAMYPNLGSATNLLGVLYMRKNDLLRAEQLFLRTHELRPNSYRTLFNLSTLYHMNGQQDRSLAYIKKGLSVSRANGEEEWFFKNFKEFQNAWNQGTCMLFIDQPSVI